MAPGQHYSNSKDVDNEMSRLLHETITILDELIHKQPTEYDHHYGESRCTFCGAFRGHHYDGTDWKPRCLMLDVVGIRDRLDRLQKRVMKMLGARQGVS